MQRTRATRSHAASLPASPSGSAFQTGSAASSPLQRSATVTATGGANGRGSDYGTSTPMPLSAVPSAATLSGQLSGRSSPRGQNASRGVDSRQTQQLDADNNDEQDEARETRSDKGKGVAREAAASSAAGSETIAGGHANPTAPRKDDDDDEAQRKRQIERVLKRAQAAKLARNFRNRIQLAAFKNQRGWQDVKLDVIEPHLEQEAQQRKQHMTLQVPAAAQSTGGHAQALFDAPRDPLNQYHHNQHPQQQQQQYQLPVYVPAGRMASHSYQPQLGGGGMDAILGGRELVSHDAGAELPPSAQQHHLYHAQQQQQHPPPPPQHYQQSDGPPTKRTRTTRGELSATYSAQDVYAPQPFPLPHSSAPYATGEVYQPPLAGGSRYPNRMHSDALASNHNAAVAATAYEHVWDSRTSPDGSRSLRQRGPFPGGMPAGGAPFSTELYSLPAPAAHRPPPQTHSSPRTRAAARRSSPPKQPLSSSDPTFSSFVDAANALTGMARAPSDPALNGAGAGGDGDQEAHDQSLARRSMDMSAAGGLRHPSSSASGHGGAASGYALPRPSTPERQVVKLPGAPNGGGGSGGGGDGATAEGAAELMLFLAASPSPVQNRKAPPPPTLGDGMPTKGRRLFSGMDTGAGEGGDASTSFGGELDPFGGGVGGNSSRSHDVGSSNNNNNTDNTNGRSVPAPAPFATASPSADPSKHFATAASASSSLSHPQQQQQAQDPSQTAFMPSAPATPGQRQRQPSLGGAWESFINASPSPKRGAATRRSRGGGGIHGSNEHADAIGAADGSSGGGGGGIGGGPGNGQATVTW